MLGPAHLNDPDVPADGGAHADVDLPQAQVDDRVRQELLDAEVGEAGRVPLHLRDEERRRVQVPQLLEELEDLVPRALERRERVQGVEAVERDEVAPQLLLVPGELTSKSEEPSRLLADLLDLPPQRADVDDVDAFGLRRIHPEGGHLRDEGCAALFHRQVEAARRSVPGLMEEDAVDEGRFQGAGGARDEDDLPAWNPAAQAVVQAGDVRGNLVRRLSERSRTPPTPP